MSGVTKGSVLACLLAGGLGLGVGLAVDGGQANVEGRREALQPRPDGRQSPARPPEEESEPSSGEPPPGDDGARQGPAPSPVAPVADERRSGGMTREVQLAREIQELKKREAEIRQQLEASQRELDSRENLEKALLRDSSICVRKTGESSVGKGR